MDTIPSNHRLAERKLIEFVKSGFWTIDDQGRIWKGSRRAEKILPSGYLLVRKMVDGKRIVGVAHRLVWQHIKGDIPDGLIINHKNGVKGDNTPDNLECSTYSGNLKHAHANGLIDQRGERNPAAKLTNNQVVQIRMAYASGKFTMDQLAAMYGVRFQHISRLVKGERRASQRGPITQPKRNNGSKKKAAGRLLDGREWNEFPRGSRLTHG